MTRLWARMTLLLSTLLLVGCGGGSGASGGDGTRYVIKVTVSGLDGSGLVLQNNGGDDLSVSANGSVQFATGLATGAAYSVTVKTQPTMLTQTCTRSNPTGTVANADVTTITLTCTSLSTPYLFSAGAAGNQVTAFSVNASDGTLSPVDTRSEADLSTPTGVAVDSTGANLYLTNSGSSGAAAISRYTINANTGTLTSAGTVTAAGSPSGIVVSADGQHVYAAGTSGGAGQLRAFSIQSGGALSVVSGSPFSVGTTPRGVAVDPKGRFVYVANNASSTISVFQRDATTGGLTTGTSRATASQPQGLAVDPGGRWLYVANVGATQLTAYSIDPTTGALTQVEVKTLANAPYDVAVDPRGTHVYAVFNGSHQIASYQINSSTGALTEISGSPWSTGLEPSAVRVDGAGRFLYVANKQSNTLSIFSITSGALALIGSPSGGAGTSPVGLALFTR
jgi:6-phosphogluconolactonase (cycloisomerase 2 family)